MGRTAAPTRQDIIEMPAIDHDSTALNNLSDAARKVIVAYGLRTTNPAVLVSEIKGFQATAVDALFQIGARLQLLHATIPHGDWERSLNELGMNESTARRIVQATVKFVGDGKARSDKLLNLGKSKLLELMVLDDEQIDVLDAGGQVGELDLDDVARMSCSELRKVIREARARLEAKDDLIQSKDTKINDLDTKLRQAKKFKPAPDAEAQTQQEQAMLDEITQAVAALEVHFSRLALAASHAVNNAMTEAVRLRAGQQLQYVHQRITEIAKDNGFEMLVGNYVPEYLRGQTTNKR